MKVVFVQWNVTFVQFHARGLDNNLEIVCQSILKGNNEHFNRFFRAPKSFHSIWQSLLENYPLKKIAADAEFWSPVRAWPDSEDPTFKKLPNTANRSRKTETARTEQQMGGGGFNITYIE